MLEALLVFAGEGLWGLCLVRRDGDWAAAGCSTVVVVSCMSCHAVNARERPSFRAYVVVHMYKNTIHYRLTTLAWRLRPTMMCEKGFCVAKEIVGVELGWRSKYKSLGQCVYCRHLYLMLCQGRDGLTLLSV